MSYRFRTEEEIEGAQIRRKAIRIAKKKAARMVAQKMGPEFYARGFAANKIKGVLIAWRRFMPEQMYAELRCAHAVLRGTKCDPYYKDPTPFSQKTNEEGF